eukprot:1200826-Amphidinium_carterae.1
MQFPVDISTQGTKKLRTARGEPLQHYGTRSVKGRTEVGQEMILQFEVLDVIGPMIGVGDLNSKGASVHLDASNSYMCKKDKKVRLRPHMKLFFLTLWLLTSSANSGYLVSIDDDAMDTPGTGSSGSAVPAAEVRPAAIPAAV